MSNSKNVFGNNNSHVPRGSDPMTPNPHNNNSGARYVPPQKREMFDNDPFIRPESSMSNASFASQFPGSVAGGVSLNELMNGTLGGSTNPYGGHSANVAPAHYGNPMSARTGQGVRPTMYDNGVGQRGLGDLGAGSMGYGATAFGQTQGSHVQGGYNQGAGGFGHTTGMYGQGASGVGPGPGSHNHIAGSFGPIDPEGGPRYGMGGMQQHPSMLSQHGHGHQRHLGQGVQNNFNRGIQHDFGDLGRIGHPAAGNSDFTPTMSRHSSVSTANDSGREGSGKALQLAALIKSGATDSPDDPEYGAPDGGRRKGGRHGQTPQKPYPVANRSTSNALMVSADPVNTGRAGDIKGNAAVFLGTTVHPLPPWFPHLQHGLKPKVEDVFNALPVIEPCRHAAPSSAGVVRIRNLPYTSTRSEVAAFVGRNAQVIPQPPGSPYFATHIIMERNTGKTMDAFVEFDRPAEAIWVVKQYHKRIQSGRHPKIGDRIVDIEVSSQGELMHELFPNAKNTKWEGNIPHVDTNAEKYYSDRASTGFTGFVQKEEIYLTIKHAETPHRSAFVERNMTRVYESWISLLHKYPWFAHEFVFMAERRLIFDATMSLADSLIHAVHRTGTRNIDQSKPTTQTLQEFTVAALTCPGFSEHQKSQLVMRLSAAGHFDMTTGKGMNLTFGGNTPLAPAWPFQVLARAPSAPYEMVEYFAALMHEATVGNMQQMSLAQLHIMHASGGDRTGPFGTVTIDYGNAKSLAEAGVIELHAIEALLKKVLPSSQAALASS